MSAAIVKSGGSVVQLDARRSPPIVITAKDVENSERLARMLQEHARAIAQLERRWSPRTLDFEDYEVTAGTPLRLNHGLGRVRWWIVEWAPATPGDPALFERNDDTDADTLVLDVGNDGRATIHVRAAG